MPKQIIWSSQAENDFDSILNYLKNNWEEQVTHKFIDLVDILIQQISLNPKQFPLTHKKKKVRKCVISKHNTLFYRDRKEAIDILRIFDNRQDPKKLRFK